MAFNYFYNFGQIPPAFKKFTIFALFKRVTFFCEVKNYRGITFIKAMAKLFIGVLLNRLVRRK